MVKQLALSQYPPNNETEYKFFSASLQHNFSLCAKQLTELMATNFRSCVS